LPIEPSQPHGREGANGLEAAGSQILRFGEFLELGRDLVARLQDQDIGLGILVYQARLHGRFQQGSSNG